MYKLILRQLNETYRETLEDYFAEQKKREQQKARHKSWTAFVSFNEPLCDMIDVTQWCHHVHKRLVWYVSLNSFVTLKDCQLRLLYFDMCSNDLGPRANGFLNFISSSSGTDSRTSLYWFDPDTSHAIWLIPYDDIFWQVKFHWNRNKIARKKENSDLTIVNLFGLSAVGSNLTSTMPSRQVSNYPSAGLSPMSARSSKKSNTKEVISIKSSDSAKSFGGSSKNLYVKCSK